MTGVARAATIILPVKAAQEEIQAASDLGEVWRRGTGEIPSLVREGAVPGSVPFFFIGETAVARGEAALPPGIDRDGFRVLARTDGSVVIRGATPFATGLGVGWYAGKALGARWFMPGPLGETVPPLSGWKPAPMDRLVAPAFVSRDIGIGDVFPQSGSSVRVSGFRPRLFADAWSRLNGLHARLPHGHALEGLFPERLFAAHPDWFPLLEGRRHRPASAADHSWQPNLALPAVADHAAGLAGAFFDRNPRAEGFSLSINDTVRFDQSEATIRARGPLRWFRGRPDYSDLVFGFVNRAADALAARHPGKTVGAYAYYWCENTPSFPVRPNVVPWLTADRSQWYDPAFQKEDRALIERWCRSGAGIVGIYDYLYGAPFLVPRATTRLTAESIRFAHRSGVRGYYAEGNPNWALDGPKVWIAAQLLWDPGQSVDALLDDYYGSFWGQAAAPMRRFDERCERAWAGQTGPAWWLKFYQDEDQVLLFPPALRSELRACIEQARALAKDPAVRARVEMVSAGFEATERFGEFCEARTALEKTEGGDPRLRADFRRRREAFVNAYDRALASGAIARTDLEVYLRNDPSHEGEPSANSSFKFQLSSFQPYDLSWSTLKSPGPLDDRTFIWSTWPWLGKGEPAEGRSIQVSGFGSPPSVKISYRHCKADWIQQWIPARPGATYRLSVRVRGRVSPGNQTFVMLNWLDASGGYVGRPAADRMPLGDWSGGKTLVAQSVAPTGAAQVGLAVLTYNQTGNDTAEFSGLELRVSDR